MTIQRDAATTAALTALGEENNPMVAWSNSVADSTIATTVGTEGADGPAANLAYPSTYDQWSVTANGTGDAAVQFTFTAPVSLTCIAIAAHSLSDAGFTVDAQYSTDGGMTWFSVVTDVTPADNQAIMWHFAATLAADWQIILSGAAAGAVATIGAAFLGVVTVIERSIYQGYTPPITQTRVELQPNMSEGGHFVGSSTIRKGSGGSVSLRNISATTIRAADWVGFQRHFNGGTPFFWAWRPEKYGDLFYAKRAGNPIAPTNSGPTDHMSAKMDMDFYDDV